MQIYFECKLVVGNIVISLDSEWIENAETLNKNQKQDCETKVFERMAKRIILSKNLFSLLTLYIVLPLWWIYVNKISENIYLILMID